MTIETRLAEIRARVDAATEGPWENDETDPGVWGLEHIIIGNYTARDDFDSPMWEDGTPEDREFIAASRTDVPWLLDQVELRDKALDAVLNVHRKMPVYEWCSFNLPSEQECHLGDDAHIELSNGEWGHANIVEAWTCEECLHDTDDYIPDWPCSTVQALTAALEVEG